MERLKQGGGRLALVCAIGIVSLLVPASAGADLPAPGPNGQVIFTSGRASGSKAAADNNTSQLFLKSSLGATPSRLSTVDSVQFRHASWSPDHTKITYASGPIGGPWDIFVRDLTQPISLSNPKNLTNNGGTTKADRPAWSPDGTRIAYQADQGANLDIKVRNADGSSLGTIATNVETGMGAASFFARPHWTPDSQTVVYARFIDATQKHDIYKSPANGSNTSGTAVITGTADDFHPYVSPDGNKICFTRQGANKDVFVASSTGGSGVGTAIDTDPGDDYECAWSPDQTQIIYVRGAANAGQIFVKNSDGSGVTGPPIEDVAATFDGNPDWAVNFRPICQNATINVAVNGFASIPLGCTDQDISDNKFISREIVSGPSHGNLGSIDDNTDSVVYTPAKDFKGTDTFTFKGNDGNSDSSPATITVEVGNTTEDVTAAKIDKVVSSNKIWRRGSALPSVLSRAKVGTIISYRLSESARVTFTFSRRTTGRKVGKRCRKTTRKNRRKRHCIRYVKAGTLHFNGKAGTNRVKFQGRLSRRKRLALGRYRLVVGAKDAAGNVSKRSRPVAFRIVRR